MLKTKVIKFIIIGIAIAVLIFVSELLYVINQKSQVYVLYHLVVAQKLATRLGPQGSMDLLTKGARINIDKVEKTYIGTVPSDYNPHVEISSASEEFKEAFVSYLTQLDIRQMARFEESDLATLFYTLGLLSYKNNAPDLTAKFFQTAVYLNPELSHFHIELANYYLASKDEVKTRTVLEFCSKFRYANEHCLNYSDNNLYWKAPEEVGFLEKPIKDHYEGS